MNAGSFFFLGMGALMDLGCSPPRGGGGTDSRPTGRYA